MKYMGSKNRIAKYILPIMLKERKEGQYWVEPFVGGGNMIDKVTGNRIGGDYNHYVIKALNAIRDHSTELPKNNKEFTEEMYHQLKRGEIDYKFKGYIGFVASYGAKWFGGWARDKTNRHYIAEAYRNAQRQSPLLQGVKLYNCSYNELPIPDNSLIYCDPPYENTTKYNDNFSHKDFWEWCRKMSKEGHTVFVSEYNAPDDFICLWEKELVSGFKTNNVGKRGVEKLFRYKYEGRQ